MHCRAHEGITEKSLGCGRMLPFLQQPMIAILSLSYFNSCKKIMPVFSHWYSLALLTRPILNINWIHFQMKMERNASCTRVTAEPTARGTSTQTESSTRACPVLPTVRSVWMATSVPNAGKDIKFKVGSVCQCLAVWVRDSFTVSVVCFWHELSARMAEMR